jgi:hypothetical protein
MNESTDVQRGQQVQAHYAEYQAIMTRINWFMSQQFMPFVPTVGFLSFVAVAHGSLGPIVSTWGVVVMLQIGSLIYYFALHEVYNHVRYLELCPKPKVASLIGLNVNLFWAWEAHLKNVGKANDPRLGDFAPTILSAGSFFVGSYLIISSDPAPGWGAIWNCVLAGISGSLWFLAVRVGLRVVAVRKTFEDAVSAPPSDAAQSTDNQI